MGRRIVIPDGVRIWAGWGHLFEDQGGLTDPSRRLDVLDVEALDPGQQRTIAKLHRITPALLEVSEICQKLDYAEIKSLLSAIGDAAEDGKRFWLKRRFLEVIEAGRGIGRFDIPIPYLPAPMPDASPSPFQLENELRLARMRSLIEAFYSSLADGSPLPPDAWWGRVILSAMINGALVKTSFLCALPQAVIASKPEMRWFVLRPLNAGNQEIPVLPRRWFPDPCTRLICARGCREGYQSVPTLDLSPHRQVYKLIHAYARARGFAEHMPRGIKELMQALITRLHHHLPAWMVDYAIDRQASVSLSDWSWDRLICPPTTYRTELSHRERIVAIVRGRLSKERGEAEESEDPAQWPQQLKGLASLLLDRQDRLRERVSEWRNGQETDLLPSVRVISEWVTDWLLTKGRSRKVKGFRTVYGMVNAIAGRLVGQLGRTDPLGLGSAEAFVEIYQTALEDTVSTKARYRVANALRSFHRYLVAERGAIPVDEKELFSVSGRVGNLVDANVIGLDTFFRILRWLRKEAKHRYGKGIAMELGFIAVLGYFCGLRRSEAIGLTTDDIDTVEKALSILQAYETWIAVTPNGLRGLKTRAGDRGVPASLLMPVIELNRLRKWFTSRKDQVSGTNASLFPSFVKNGKVNDKDPKLELITHALQHCTDDSTLRYHHLRHSFASWLLFMFWLGEEGNPDILPNWFLPTNHDRARWQIAADLRRALLGQAPTNRRTVLQVSALMGHSGSDITFSTYIHLADFIVGRTARRLTRDFDEMVLATLSGYSETYLKKLSTGFKFQGRPEYRAASFMDDIADRVLRDGQHRTASSLVAKVDFRAPTPVEMPTAPLERLLHIAKAINEIEVKHDGIESIAHRYGCSAAELQAWHTRYRDLPAGLLCLSGRNETGLGAVSDPIELPVGNALELAGRTCSLFEALVDQGDSTRLKPPAARKKLDGLIEDFVNYWEEGSYLSITTESVPVAKAWWWWIDKIGYSKGLVISHEASSGSMGEGQEGGRRSVPSAQRQREHWAKSLENPEIVDSGRQMDSGTRGRVHIRINVRNANNDELPYQQITALYGVRFVLAMKCVLARRPSLPIS